LTAPQPAAEESEEPSTKGEESIADMIRNEVMQVKKQRHWGTQDFISINTGIKGIVLVKISRRDICPIMLVKSIFDLVSAEKVPISRHLVKLIPLQLIYFAGEEEFGNVTKLLVEGTFTNPTGVTLPTLQLSRVVHNKRKAPEEGDAVETGEQSTEDAQGDAKRAKTEDDPEGAADASAAEATAEPAREEPVAPVVEEAPAVVAAPAEPVSTVPREIIKYMVLFKARNHNTLTKTFVLQKFRELVPPHLRQDYLLAKVSIVYSVHCLSFLLVCVYALLS